MTFKLVVISPEKKVLEMDCKSVTLPTMDGEITVLPNHMAVFSLLKPGEMTARGDKGNLSLAIGGGFVNITKEKVTVLPEFGVRSDEINEEKVKEARKRAEQILSEKASETNSAMAQASLARSLLELKVAQRRKKSV